VRLAALVAALVLAAPASAHPGHAPPTVSIGLGAYDPQEIQIVAGDIVQWSWDGPDVDHSVTSDADSTETFDSGVKNQQGATFRYFFATPGTYSYHCKKHDMHGTVVVAEGAATDSVAPTVKHVRAKVKGRSARVSFKISEDASVTARVRRPGQKKVLHRSFKFVKAGAARTKVRVGRGRSRVSIFAEDATGNRSKLETVTVTR
jgi:plastocyanin